MDHERSSDMYILISHLVSSSLNLYIKDTCLLGAFSYISKEPRLLGFRLIQNYFKIIFA